MAERIGKAVLTIEIDGQQVQLGLGQITKANETAAKQVKDGWNRELTGDDFKKWSAVAIGAIAAVGAGIVALGDRGADIDDVAGSFGDLTAQVGSTAEALLGELRNGTLGTISDFELMKLANGALSSGLISSADAAGTLAQGAQLLADRTGGDTAEAFGTLTTAIATGRTATLKQLGVFVDTKVAVEQYAAAHGKAAGQLSDFERTQALAAATLAALKSQLQANGPAAADFGELVARIKTGFQNFVDQLSVGIARSPVLNAALKSIGVSLEENLGPKQKGNIVEIIRTVQDFAIAMSYAVEGGAVAATVFVTAWYGVQTVVLGVTTAIAGVATMLAQFVTAVALLAAKVPGASDSVKAMAASALDLTTKMRGGTESLAAQTAEAAKGVAGQSALQGVIDKVAGANLNMRDKMIEASTAAITLDTEVKKTNTTLGDGAPAQRNAENVKAIADSYWKLSQDVVLATMEGTAKRLAQLEFAKLAEIKGINDLKEASRQEKDERIALANEKYAALAAIELAATDQTKARTLELQNTVAQDYLTGTALVVAQLQAREQAELASIATLQVTNAAAYTEQAALIQQHYANATAAAQGHYATVEQAASAAGFKTREELEQAATKAQETYQRMLASGLYTTEELRKAHEAAKKAEAEVDGHLVVSKMEGFQLIAAAASTVLRSIFGKSKGAAIAAALIDAAAAIVKVFAQYGFPWGLAPAAAIAAQTGAQIAKIRNTNPEGFATGTPGLDFANFGSSTLSVLHRQEAVIPRGRGHLLAAEIAAAMPRGGRGDGAMAAELRGIRDDLARLPRVLARGIRDGMLLAT